MVILIFIHVMIYTSIFQRIIVIADGVNLLDVAYNGNGQFYYWGRGNVRFYNKQGNTKHRFPEFYTYRCYHAAAGSPVVIQERDFRSIEAGIPQGEDLMSLWNSNDNKYMLNIWNVSSYKYLIQEQFPIYNVLNPALLYRRSHKDWILIGRVYGKDINHIIQLKNFNTSSLSKNFQKLSNQIYDLTNSWFSENKDSLQIDTKLYSFYKFKNNWEDPRLLELSNGKVIASFAHRNNGQPEIGMTYAEISFKDGQIYVKHIVKIIVDDPIEGTKDQKNWSPFVYNNELYFSGSIYKNHIIYKISLSEEEINNSDFTRIGKAIVIANTTIDDINEFHWDLCSPQIFPCLKGGTQAIQINDDTFLAFFHTYGNTSIEFNGLLQTYTFGAYTFKAGDDFHITSISTEPIIHESFYQGHWLGDGNSFGAIDYVVFPMSFIIEDDFVYLVYGSHDMEGRICKMSLSELLSSMKDITRKDSPMNRHHTVTDDQLS